MTDECVKLIIRKARCSGLSIYTRRIQGNFFNIIKGYNWCYCAKLNNIFLFEIDSFYLILHRCSLFCTFQQVGLGLVRDIFLLQYLVFLIWLCCKKFLSEHWGSKIKYTSKQMPRFNANSKTYMLKLFSYQYKLDSMSYDIEPRDLQIKFTRYVWFFFFKSQD